MKKVGVAILGLGVVGGGMEYPGILGSMEYGFYKLQYWMTYTVDSLRMLVTGQVGLQDMSGPVGMAAVVDEVYEAAAPAGFLAVVLSLMKRRKACIPAGGGRAAKKSAAGEGRHGPFCRICLSHDLHGRDPVQ